MKALAVALAFLPLAARATEPLPSLQDTIASWGSAQRERTEAVRMLEARGFRCDATRAYVPAHGAAPRQFGYITCTRTVASPRCMNQRMVLKLTSDERNTEGVPSAEESACL